ncbi:MAG TPA: hypothetical protein VFP72_25145 [Kineosporiaceae bacterium]|nr:hypothetical protein [Kineosporiaceae bacterium]
MPTTTLAGHRSPTHAPSATAPSATSSSATGPAATAPSATVTAQPGLGARRHGTAGPRTLRSRWARFLNTVLPAPSPDRLVPVAEVSRGLTRFVEEGLADAEISPVLQELPSMTGESRFRVLVPASSREVAMEILAGF